MRAESAIPDARDARDVQFAVRVSAFTLAVFSVGYFSGGSPETQLVFAALCVLLFAGLFVARPTAVPICAIVSVASGGIELQLSGTTPKLFFATLVVVAYVISVFVRTALAHPVRHRLVEGWQRIRRLRRAETTIAVLLLIYLALLTPSLAQMLVPQRSLYILAMRAVTIVGVILFVRESRIPRSPDGVLFALTIVGSVIALTYSANAVRVYGATSFSELAVGLALKDNTVQVGMLGTTNTIASFLAVTLPCSVAYASMPAQSVQLRAYAIIAIVIQAFGLVATASRGGIVAILTAILIAAGLGNRSFRDLSKAFRFVAAATIVLCVMYLVMGEAIRERFSATFSFNTLGFYAVRRSQLWLSSWTAFTTHPLFGIGVGNVGFFDRDYGTGDGSESHNLLLQTLAEEGILSAVILGALLFALVRKNAAAAKKGGTTRLWILVALLAALVHSLIEPTFWHPAFATLFWFTCVFFYRNSLIEIWGKSSSRQHIAAERFAAAPIVPVGSQGGRPLLLS
jgi:O-antigen ligase